MSATPRGWNFPVAPPAWKTVVSVGPSMRLDLGADLSNDESQVRPTLAQFLSWFAQSQLYQPQYPGLLGRLNAGDAKEHTTYSMGDSEVALGSHLRLVAGTRALKQIKNVALAPASWNAMLTRFCFNRSLGGFDIAHVADKLVDVAAGKAFWPSSFADRAPADAEMLRTAGVLRSIPDEDLWRKEFPVRRSYTVDMVAFRLAEACNAGGVSVPLPDFPVDRSVLRDGMSR